MATAQKLEATSGGKEYIERTIEVLTPTFENDPVYTWLLQNLPVSKHQSVLPKLLRAFFHQGTRNSGVFIEVGDFGSCGLFMPPGAQIENPFTMLQAGLLSALYNVGFGPFKRVIFEYASATEIKLKETFTKEEQKSYWYVFIMGSAVDRLRKGYASALLVHLQNRARGDGHPIWLEATTLESRDLYLKHGFTDVGKIVLGAGKVGSDGLPKKDGEGITIWSMFWRP